MVISPQRLLLHVQGISKVCCIKAIVFVFVRATRHQDITRVQVQVQDAIGVRMLQAFSYVDGCCQDLMGQLKPVLVPLVERSVAYHLYVYFKARILTF